MQIQRVTNSTQLNIVEFNALLDEGTVWTQDAATAFLSDSDNALFVAEVEGHLVGFLTAYKLQRFDQKHAEVLLYEIGVDEDYRRQGVATALIEALNTWARSMGAKEVWVLTEQENTVARALYATTGGVEDGPRTTMFTYALE